MIVQAYMDESIGKDLIVLAGLLAPAEKWEQFADEWDDLVKWGGTIHKDGSRSFKMSEMRSSGDRSQKILPFFRVIEKYAEFGLSIHMAKSDFERAKPCVFNPKGSISFEMTAYQSVFALMLDIFHANRAKFEEYISGNRVDFIFDDISEKKGILSEWDDFLRKQGSAANLYGSTPRFEDDKEFLPLQAADFWAWHIRDWAEKFPISDSRFGKFENLSAKVKIPFLHITLDRDLLRRALRNSQRSDSGRGYSITFGCFDELNSTAE